MQTAQLQRAKTVEAKRGLSPGGVVFGNPPDHGPFILSPNTQQALTRRARLWATLCLLLGVPLGLYCLCALQLRGLH